MSRRWAAAAVLFCVVSGLSGYLLAEGYIDRLPNHRGYFLVGVPDQVAPQAAPTAAERPRHAVLILLDGLRADHAMQMTSVDQLRQAGQCRKSDVGPLSVSRPVYAVVSTGLEQDRTGVRINDCSIPLPVESIFQVAHRAGRRVFGVSELPWVPQLFPDGFDGFEIVARSDDHFRRTESALGDLSLFLPIYIDETAHDFGAASPQYRESVARADAEVGRLLGRLDLRRDLVVLTADHGHSDRGGHGARSPEVAQVLTCFSGFGVRKLAAETAPPFPSRAIGPALALLSGLPFPQHMRAGEDGLDVLFELADPAVYRADYLADRQAALSRFRQQNRQSVAGWLGQPGEADWSALYRRQSLRQAARGLAVFSAMAGLLAIIARRLSPRPTSRQLAELGGFCGLACGGLVVVWIALRGSFDFTSMNERADFIKWVIVASLLTLATTLGLSRLRRRPLAEITAGLVALVALLGSVNAAHIVAFGWPMGFPLPGPLLLFVPFIAGSFQAVVAVTALPALAMLLRQKARAAKPSP